MKILQKHLFDGLVRSWASVTVVLTAILIFSQLPLALNRAATREIGTDILLKFVGWVSIANLPVILPITVLLATVLAYGRFGSDGELGAMRTSGCSPGFLLVPVLWLAVPVAVLQAFLSLYLAPLSLCSAAAERGQAARTAALAPVAAGKFQSYGAGVVLFVESVGADGALKKVFIKRQTGDSIEVIVAERGQIEPRPDLDLVRVKLVSGRRYEGVPGRADYRLVSFGTYAASFAIPAIKAGCNRPDARPTTDLWTSNEPKARAELNGRLGLPLMVLILAVLALTLSTTRPREGPYARLPLAIVVFFVYSFATIGLTTFSSRNVVAGSVAFWSLHALVACVALFAFWRMQRGGVASR
jgi:lipopolysaccharide export system permease protein